MIYCCEAFVTPTGRWHRIQEELATNGRQQHEVLPLAVGVEVAHMLMNFASGYNPGSLGA